MKRILVGTSTFASADRAPLNKLLESGFEAVVNPLGRKLTGDELLNLLSGAEGIIAGLETLDRNIMERSDLRVISRCGAGIDNIDLRAAEELGIKVFSTPDAPTNAVAELTVGAIVCLIRDVARMSTDLHNGKWSKKIGLQLEGSAIAVIGFGRIGQRVAELLKAFKAAVIAVDANLKGTANGVPISSLDEALPKADIITVHASGDKTILGKREFAMMKKGVFLLNAARGNLIDEDELVRGLDDGRVAGAWFDCFKEEPYRGPLARYPQVLMTPHIGSYTARCRARMEMEAVDNIINFFEGR